MISIVRYHERAVSTGLQRFIVTRVEGEASLGVRLVRKTGGGAIVEKILPTGLAAQCSEIRPYSELVKINEIDVSKLLFGHILYLLGSVGRPVKLTWYFFINEGRIIIHIARKGFWGEKRQIQSFGAFLSDPRLISMFGQNEVNVKMSELRQGYEKLNPGAPTFLYALPCCCGFIFLFDLVFGWFSFPNLWIGTPNNSIESPTREVPIAIIP